MNLRLILLIVGTFIILAIVVDGLCRSFRNKKERSSQSQEKIMHLDSINFKTKKLQEANLDLFEAIEKTDDEQLNLFKGKAEIFPTQPDLLTMNETQYMEKQKLEPDFLVLHVLATSGRMFRAVDLFRVLVKHQCRFGEKNLFHRYVIKKGVKEFYFSVASAVQPGTFNVLDKTYTTKGLVFLTRCDAQAAMKFDLMLTTVKSISADLEGTVSDEKRQPLTEKTLALYREKITHANN